MDAAELPELKDIHLPGTPDIWPLALGWWLLLALVLGLAIGLYFVLRKKRCLKKHKQMLFNELSQVETKLQNADKEAIAETNILLRRLALAYYPDEHVASLTGRDWLKFLDNSGNTQDFTRGAGRILIEAPYRSGELENYNGDEFIVLIRHWVTHLSKKVGGCL